MDKNPDSAFIDYLNSMGGRNENAADFDQAIPDNQQTENVANNVSALGKVFVLQTFSSAFMVHATVENLSTRHLNVHYNYCLKSK